MRASGSTVLKRLPWAKAPAMAQFHREPHDVKRAAQTPDIDKLPFEKPTELADGAYLSFGPYRLLPTQYLLLEGDKPVPIGSRALELLMILLERRGELVSKQELTARVWPNVFVDPSNLTTQMAALRHALRDRKDGNRFIITDKGRGYRFVASVSVSGHDN